LSLGYKHFFLLLSSSSQKRWININLSRRSICPTCQISFFLISSCLWSIWLFDLQFFKTWWIWFAKTTIFLMAANEFHGLDIKARNWSLLCLLNYGNTCIHDVTTTWSILLLILSLSNPIENLKIIVYYKFDDEIQLFKQRIVYLYRFD
jgi:hypothetical protein